MQLLPLLVATLMGLSALACVLYPLFRRTSVETQKGASQSETLSSQAEGDSEETARSALQEIELDFQLGNLAERDYRFLRERYLRRAFLAMRARQKREQELDQLIEVQLRRMKKEKEVEGHNEE